MNTAENNKKSIKFTRQTAGNMFILAGILIITTLEWHVYEWYSTFTRYGTLITFAALAGAFFCYVDIKDALRDKLFYLMVITDVIAAINLIIIGSNKGCILIVADFMLILYLADKIVFSKYEMYAVLIYTAFFFFYWTVDVKGYFKGYNTNYGGLILITGFAFFTVLYEVVRYERFGNVSDNKAGNATGGRRKIIYTIAYIVAAALAFNIISWYRSRTALAGLIVLLVLYVMPSRIIMNRIVYMVITIAATAGSIAFSGVYILLGSIGDGSLRLFYKSVISGRNEIWGELWEAFFAHPITGIGSSYEMKLDYMQGMFEAHSAMMDILIVHGVIVFVLLCGLLIYRILKLYNVAGDRVGKAVFAALICILVTGFFENFYIVQPFSLLLLCLFAVENSAQFRTTNQK